ncbi:ATP-binding protein [Arthrospira platensis SPKY1]|nr:ATP-binding protein [Arthrospira platensis SPKY1]
MNEQIAAWENNNEAYLAAALAWLRERLSRLGVPPAETAVTDEPRRFGLFGRSRIEESDRLLAAPSTLARLSERLTEAEAVEPPPALLILARRLGLSRFEQDILLLCLGMELDTRFPTLCAQAQDDPNRPYPTFALALALFDEPAWEALSPERPLRYWQLIEINQPGAQPLTTSALRIDERILNFAKGLNYLDDRLAPLLAPFEVSLDDELLPPSQETAVTQIIGRVRRRRPDGAPLVIQLLGPDSLSKQMAAQRAAAELGLHLNRLPAELLPTDPGQLERIARLWQRESILLPVALYLDAHDGDGEAAGGQTPPLQRFLARSQGIFFLGTRDLRAGLGAAATAVEIHRPTPAEQQAIWQAVLAVSGERLSANGDDAWIAEGSALLAGQFNLNAPAIRQIGRSALAEPTTAETDPSRFTHHVARLWHACLTNTRPRLDLLAQRIDPKAVWDDIVLSDELAGLLRQISVQVAHRHTVYDAWGFRDKMSRGLGLSALFAGESGTGKTMAAEVLANELRLNLYRIDLSAVVSKYIGETEKNLRRLFDAAEDGGAILFFDEADALFGKRSEVKDSHDRYANIEINYLLQRMEAYRGLAILATNRKSALDSAFMRRLRFVVNFAFPDLAQRRAIWRRILPPQTPQADLDFDHLARLNLTGGSIQNVALNAAFLAAQRDEPVTMPLLLEAARAELRKLERPVRERDLAWDQ